MISTGFAVILEAISEVEDAIAVAAKIAEMYRAKRATSADSGL